MLVLQVLGQGHHYEHHHYEHHHQNLVLKLPLTSWSLVEPKWNTGVQHVRNCSLKISKQAGRIGCTLDLDLVLEE